MKTIKFGVINFWAGYKLSIISSINYFLFEFISIHFKIEFGRL